MVSDSSPRFRRSRLYLESLLRRTPPTDARIYLGDQGALNPAPYQLDPAHMALESLRARILIADGVGLGKTIEVGVLLSELIKRGQGDRILVIAIRSMLAQFQQEIWARFAIPLVRLDSVGIQRVRARIPANKNPFTYYDRAIISIDTLKNDAQYRHYLEECHWDVIVIDECHNVANAGSQRNRLAGLLARTCDSLILTSATPHNGRSESFANLMNMLEPTAIADPANYGADEIRGLFVRRFKKDIEDQVADQFQERTVSLERVEATANEERAFALLQQIHLVSLHRTTTQDALFRIGLLKAFLSSPAACLETIDGRIHRLTQRLQGDDSEEDGPEESVDTPQLDILAELGGAYGDAAAQRQDTSLEESCSFANTITAYGDAAAQRQDTLRQDVQRLQELREAVVLVDDDSFGKLRRLLTLLAELGVDGSAQGERIIIFSERIATLHFLRQSLQTVLAAGEGAIALFHAGLPDQEQQYIVESFGKADSPIRVLLASDVASEGVNLHYYCHLMIHFDIPWSLITLEQRNGRIDRYGQERAPFIYYLLTLSQQETVKADLRVLERLIAKEEEAHKNIGDAATILGLHDAQREEERIARGMAGSEAPESILPDQSPEDAWLSVLMGGAAPESSDEDVRGNSPTLYAGDMEFARAAFSELGEGGLLERMPDYHPERPAFELLAPDDLRRRCRFLPDEALPEDWVFHLSTDRAEVMKAIAQARLSEGKWPQTHLFWELHPVMEWLLDRLLVRFGRHEAPVIVAREAMDPSEFILLFQGILSNQRSQPVIVDWFGLVGDLRSGFAASPLSLNEVLDLSGFGPGLPNPGRDSRLVDELRERLPQAIELARQHMGQLRAQRSQSLRNEVVGDMRRLQQWQQTAVARLTAERSRSAGNAAARLDHEINEANALYTQRQKWLNESVSTDDRPYLRLAAVFAGS